jgi:hypothetical protein
MSTPDKNNTTKGAERSSDAGVNAWKVNRTGLASPVTAESQTKSQEETVKATPEGGVPSAFKPIARKRGKGWLLLNLAAAVALLLVLGKVWFDNRSGTSSGITSIQRSKAEPGTKLLPVTEQDSHMPKYRALVIGINKYAQAGGEGWPQLRSARGDAEAIAETLASEYGFEVQTLLDEKATRGAILNAMDDMATTGDDGADLIYFAGHGCFDEELQEGYWIPADARKTIDGHDAKEGWLWNSTLTRLISASNARHVLVLSDACYSGSLFRGDQPLSARSSQGWYERAISKPSRYLITSGGLEPVLDSGDEHSVFAQQVLNYLKYSDPKVFSANDLGSALRERVAALTGQMVQMGPLPVSGHAGGEFVFVRQEAGLPLAQFSPVAPVNPVGGLNTRGADASDVKKSRDEALRNALALTREGAPKSANSLINVVLQQNAQDHLALAVSDYIKRNERQEGRDELQNLIDKIEKKSKENVAAGAAVPALSRPRVLACLGPELPSGGPDAENIALLYRIVLRSELESHASLRVIEREALETLLQEQNLGTSNLADSRARLAIGKLLPASLLLLGDVLPSEKGDSLYLRLVDTETTQVLASFSAKRLAEDDQEKVCAELATRIAERIVALKPLLAQVTEVNGTRIRASLGTYHALNNGASFTVLSRKLRDKKVPDDFEERELGIATVRKVSEFSCELDVVWNEKVPSKKDDLWIKERGGDRGVGL